MSALLRRGCSAILLAAAAATSVFVSHAQEAIAAAAVAAGGTVRGSVKAGAIPLPGVAVTATNTLTGKKYATATDVEGNFSMTIPNLGRYVVRAELAAFAPVTTEIRLTAEAAAGTASFSLELLSRAAAAEAATARSSNAGLAGLATALGRGTQSLSISGVAEGLTDASTGSGNAAAAMPSLGGGLGGDSAATDSVAISGQQGQTNALAGFSEDQIRERITEALAQARQQGGAAGDQANAVISMIGSMMGGGGFGGGGRGGPGGGSGGGAFRNFNPTQPHGVIFYQGGFGALNALPFSLSGAPESRQGNAQNRFGVSFTGSPYLPGVTRPNQKQFIFLNVSGQRNITPDNYYAVVPTIAERLGDFRGLTQFVSGVNTPILIYDPATGQQASCNGVLNVFCSGRLSPEALALLNYYPAPSIPVAGNNHYNYQTVTTSGSNSTQAALRYVRNFGAQPTFGQGRQQTNAQKSLRQNINFNGSYTGSAGDNRNVFLPLGGATANTGYGLTAGYTVGYGRLNNNASINWNRSHANTYNYFTDTGNNPATESGVPVGNGTIFNNPFYAGVPSLTFSGFTGLYNQTPSNSINQTISFSDFVSWSHKKHNMRFGGDLRRVHSDLIGGTNVLGSFTFSGCQTQVRTAANPNPCAPSQAGNSTNQGVATNTGAGFADFLLGLPQQATVQASLSKLYLRETMLDWFAQDDYRVLSNVTLNFGLRYEYFGPFTEKYNRLTNLDHNADFTQVAIVTPGQQGAITGYHYPTSLVRPDRSLYSPRFGLAWRPAKLERAVVRAGYGLNFNTSQNSRFAQRLSDQQPFAVTQTNIAYQQGCGTLTLANAYNCSNAAVQSNFAVNPDYRLGHVQVYNLDVQKTFNPGIVVNIGYSGSKGGNLDIVRAPNRTASGLLNTNVQAFNYEDSLGFSRQNALTINVRKRLQKGVSLQATYVYGHSIDDASSINGNGNSVAQDDRNLLAEESNSSFDVRHKVNGNWLYELPIGPNRTFLNKGGKVSKLLDGFNVSGDFTFASGSYFTPQYVATAAETATGSNNSLRPDRVSSQSINGARSFGQWFNPKAFATPALGFGTASRNSIEGPGVVSVNASFSRSISFGETRSFEARMIAANVFNTVQYSGINTVLNSQNFGQVTSTAGMRSLTFQGRYRF